MGIFRRACDRSLGAIALKRREKKFSTAETAETLDMKPSVDVASSGGKFWRTVASARKWPVAGASAKRERPGRGGRKKSME